MITYFKAEWDETITEVKQEMYNLKDQDSLKMFNEMAENGTFLSEVFENDNKDIETWFLFKQVFQKDQNKTNQEKQRN